MPGSDCTLIIRSETGNGKTTIVGTFFLTVIPRVNEYVEIPGPKGRWYQIIDVEHQLPLGDRATTHPISLVVRRIPTRGKD